VMRISAMVTGKSRWLFVMNRLCVPKTSSTSCAQAVLVDQAISTSLFSDAVVVEVDRFG
jgi:hypothetical protein